MWRYSLNEMALIAYCKKSLPKIALIAWPFTVVPFITKTSMRYACLLYPSMNDWREHANGRTSSKSFNRTMEVSSSINQDMGLFYSLKKIFKWTVSSNRQQCKSSNTFHPTVLLFRRILLKKKCPLTLVLWKAYVYAKYPSRMIEL